MEKLRRASDENGHRSPDSLNIQTNKRREILIRICREKAKCLRQGVVASYRYGNMDSYKKSQLLLESLREHSDGQIASSPDTNFIQESFFNADQYENNEEDEIIVLLNGDRDLYLSLMADLETALMNDVEHEEKMRIQAQDQLELQAWERQCCQERERDIDNIVTPVSEILATSSSMRSVTNETLNESENLLWPFECTNYSEINIDYLICPLCKRQCMDVQERDRLAICCCGTSIYICRKRCVASQKAVQSGQSMLEDRGPLCLSITEVKTIIAYFMEKHQMFCSVLAGRPLTIDSVAFELVNSALAPDSNVHPHLYFHCYHCTKLVYVL